MFRAENGAKIEEKCDLINPSSASVAMEGREVDVACA
jgi:hypothetical protein